MAPTDLLNLNDIRQLVADMGGNQEIVLILLMSLENDLARSIQEMHDAVVHNNSDQLRRAAHRLKDSYATLDATIAAALCQESETMGQDNEIILAAPDCRTAGRCLYRVDQISARIVPLNLEES